MGARRNTGRLGSFLLGALVIAVLSAPASAQAVLQIGTRVNQNTPTTQQQANAIAAYLELISGYTVQLAPQNPNNQPPFWTVQLGAAVQNANKPVGHALVLALINSARTITIVVSAGGDVGVTSCANGFQKVQVGAQANACKETNGNPGPGSDAIVELASVPASVLTDADTPRYIVVAHELIHALHVTIGRRLTTNSNNEARTIGPYAGYNGAQNPPLIPGFQFTENALRGENTYSNSKSPARLTL